MFAGGGLDTQVCPRQRTVALPICLCLSCKLSRMMPETTDSSLAPEVNPSYQDNEETAWHQPTGGHLAV